MAVGLIFGLIADCERAVSVFVGGRQASGPRGVLVNGSRVTLSYLRHRDLVDGGNALCSLSDTARHRMIRKQAEGMGFRNGIRAAAGTT